MISPDHVPSSSGSAQPETVSPGLVGFSWLSRRAAYFAVVAIILSIYSYPAVRTALTTRSLRLPPVTAPDLGLYLSLSKLEKSSDGATLNPYYHIGVPYPVAYLKFRLGPILFGLLNELFMGRIWWALFVWNLLLWGLLCAAAIWLFDQFLPHSNLEFVLVGVALLTLFTVEGSWRVLSAWIHLSPAWFTGGLPYIRAFTPQFAMPLLLCYLGLQIRALRGASIRAWGIMALLQFVAFAAFPYATLMMAGITAVAAVWYLLAGPRASAWREVLAFLLVCGLADVAFALHGSGGFRLTYQEQTSLITFQPALARESLGKMWFLAAVLTAATALTRKLRPEVKWPLVGMGLANILFVLGDAIVSERVLFLAHIGGFYQSTTVILFIFFVSAYIPGAAQPPRLARTISLATLVLCFFYGLSEAEANYRVYLPYNLEQADLASWVARGEVSARDLVITQFTISQYDDCEWMPLLSEAELLYCRNAQVVLTPQQNRDVQRLREVLYLYFDGKDHEWLADTTHLERYGLYGDVTSFRGPEERAARIVSLRQQMLPLFDRVEHGDPSIQAFFRRFQRVWILQARRNQPFVKARLASYLNLGEQETVGSLLVTSSDPK